MIGTAAPHSLLRREWRLQKGQLSSFDPTIAAKIMMLMNARYGKRHVVPVLPLLFSSRCLSEFLRVQVSGILMVDFDIIIPHNLLWMKHGEFGRQSNGFASSVLELVG